MPTVHCYLRVSTIDQAESGLGLAAGREQCRACYDRDYAPLGLAWGGFYEDVATSGKKPIASRPEGGRLDRSLRAGDVVVFPKLDRAFRSLSDQVLTMESWRRRGVTMRFLDISLDTSSPVGQAVAELMGVFAKLERHRISERTKEALWQRIKEKGHGGAGPAPIGWRWKTAGGRPPRPAKPRRLLPDHDERVLMAMCHHLYVERGLRLPEVVQVLKKNGVVDLRSGNPVDEQWVQRRVHAHRKLLAGIVPQRVASDGKPMISDEDRAAPPGVWPPPPATSSPRPPDAELDAPSAEPPVPPATAGASGPAGRSS